MHSFIRGVARRAIFCYNAITMPVIIIIAFILGFFGIYFLFPPIFNQLNNFSQVFLTIATFSFTIFTGFFIARQGNRYSRVRDQITTFAGEMSSLYRVFGHFGPKVQEEAKKNNKTAL